MADALGNAPYIVTIVYADGKIEHYGPFSNNKKAAAYAGATLPLATAWHVVELHIVPHRVR